MSKSLRVKNSVTILLLLTAATVGLLLLNVMYGSVSIPLADVLSVLTGGEASKSSWTYIVIGSRLPQAVTALMAGASLAAAGLLMQTIFNNPLAGPSVLGITNGASLGVALVMLLTGGTIGTGTSLQLTGFLAIVAGALVGAMSVMAMILAFSSLLRSNVMLLIVGMMVGYLTSSVVSLLNYFATQSNVHGYVMWGMGSFGDVTLTTLPWFTATCSAGIIISALMAKPLNALLLGQMYAQNLGINVRRVRVIVLVASGMLTAIVTAFCGPIAFVGLAVPHIARMLVRTSSHQQLFPTTVLCGAIIALLCNLVSTMPFNFVIPVNALTPLFGAPVIIYIIVKGSRL